MDEATSWDGLMPRPRETLTCPSHPPAHKACHLLVLPVVVAVVATDVLDACQKVVQELKRAQGQVKPYYWAPPLPRLLNGRPPSTLVQLCSAQPYSSRTSQEVAPIPHSS